MQTNQEQHNQHQQLIDHDWRFNEVERMYSHDFLTYPPSLALTRAYRAHKSMIEYFENSEEDRLRS